MVDINRSTTLVVQLEHVSVPVVPPPGAQLPVPAASQRIKKFRVLHANHGEEVLVAQMSPESILLRQCGHVARLQQLVVEKRRSHGTEVQEHHAAVEARKAIGRRFSNFGLRVFFAILPEGVSERG